MRRKLAVILGLAAVLSAAPVGFSGVAAACPDPDNPCTPQPHPFPISWCKIDPRC